MNVGSLSESSFHPQPTARNGMWPLFAVTLFILLLPQPVRSQTLQAIDPHSQTPVQVRTGSATLTQHYDPSKTLRLTIALTHPHPTQERTLIDALHDKHSPLFHQYLSSSEWDARFAPSVEDEQAVVDWANSQGLSVTNRYPDRLLVDVVATAGAIEKAFNLKINSYKVGSETYYSNDRDPEIPPALTNTIQAIFGLNSFFQLRPAIAGSRSLPARPDYVAGPPAAEDSEQRADGSAEKLAEALKQSAARAAASPLDAPYSFVPTDIYSSEAYNYNGLRNLGHCCNPLSNPGNSPAESTIAIASFADLQYSDVASFHTQFPYLAYDIQKKYIDGTYVCNNSPNPDDGCIEVTLDTEWSLSMANSFGSYAYTSKVWIYEGASYGDIADVYNTMATDGYAKVTSTSWGCTELTCWSGPGMLAMDGIFNKMAGEGWTLIAATGDQGSTAGCGDAVLVQFPGSDPNFIGAGGTLLSLNAGPEYVSEVGWTGGTYSTACQNNNGGSTGGFSDYFNQSNGLRPSYQAYLGFYARAVPDISLNAAHGQDVYDAAAGGLVSYGGTSIVAPELAGFFAQENAYGLSIGSVCGGSGTSPCAPVGEANYYMYDEAEYHTAAHYPFYDITSGCNSNNITAEFDLLYYCAGPGYDEVTGLGTANMLQLAWAINWYDAKANGGPSISFGGPTVNKWYHTDQLVDWDVIDNIGSDGGSGTGIAGYTQGWDSIPNDAYSFATPGAGDSFYSGPQHANTSFGCTDLSGALCTGGPVSQGCHTVHVRGWNNMGVSSGAQSYGPICYDTIAPVVHLSLSGTLSGAVYLSSVGVALSATDPGAGSTGSGVSAIYYTLDGGALTTYARAFTVSSTGIHTLKYYATDIAGNVETTQTTTFDIESPTTTAFTVSNTSPIYGNTTILTAKVTPSFGGVAAGAVTFYLNGIPSVSAPLGATGIATYALPASLLKIGANSIYADYTGSTGDAASKSSVVSVTVSKASTTTTLASSANPAAYGATITLTATVKPSTSGTPTGSVVFKTGSKFYNVPLSGGKALLVLSSQPVGTYPFTATYSGSGDYLTSVSATLTQVVKAAPTTTLLTSSANPAYYGSKFTLTATVKPATTGTATGDVVFKSGTLSYTVALTGGVAHLVLGPLAVGSYPFTATYSGSVDYLASTSSILTQVVKAATTTTTLISSVNPSTSGEAVTFTATVTSSTAVVPTGTVEFLSNGANLGLISLVSKTSDSGVATLTTKTLATGTDSIQAVYLGTADLDTSKSAILSQVVKP
jgi:hypothetical protein